MELLVVAFVAGVLTVLAPCILPLIPVTIGASSLASGDARDKKSFLHPLIIVGSLTASIIVFTLLLKASTALLGVPTLVWNYIAGGIVILFGINSLAPNLWEWVVLRTGLQAKSSQLLGKTNVSNLVVRDILLGAALGPVFNSCSPTYALIVAVVLPASFATGLVYLLAYSVGLGTVLFLVSIFGRSFVNRVKWMSNPSGWFQKAVGVMFIVVGCLLIIGADKQIQSFVIEQGWYNPIMKIEEAFE